MATINIVDNMYTAVSDDGYMFSHKTNHALAKTICALSKEKLHLELEHWDEITIKQASDMIDKWCSH